MQKGLFCAAAKPWFLHFCRHPRTGTENFVMRTRTENDVPLQAIDEGKPSLFVVSAGMLQSVRNCSILKKAERERERGKELERNEKDPV